MLGWEFPPFFAGGAGIVCGELTKALNEENKHVTFIMPRGPEEQLSIANSKSNLFKIKAAFPSIEKSTTFKTVKTIIKPYMGFEEYHEKYTSLQKTNEHLPYGKNLAEEVYRFADEIYNVAKDIDFDIIHAHDWTTFLAGVKLKEKTGKPLVIHVHITEFDKTGGANANPKVYEIESLGITKADRIIAVSNKVKERLVKSYRANKDVVRVVHNAATPMNKTIYDGKYLKGDKKMVLFAGRVTMQKGPEYFVEAAKKALEYRKDIIFVVAGTGDMLPSMIKKVEDYGLKQYFHFHGFYTRQEAEEIFSMADVFIMPSISEPFGVVPFEAQIKKTPTIISKQSGISEILEHTLKVDFWDTKEMANKMLAILEYESLHKELQNKGYFEANTANWTKPARQCIKVYEELVQ